MSRMLEALKRIQAKSPQTRPAIQPVSPEELQLFGLRQPADLRVEELLQAVESIQAVDPQLPQAVEPDHQASRLFSPLADQYREQYADLADNLLAQLSPVRPAVLMFTSAGDGEGKTVTLASLAVVLAEKVSDEVVAVDANWRSPALAGRFGIWADHGLVDVLTGGAQWRDVVRATSVNRLSVLPGGRLPRHDGSLPEELKLAPVLDALRLRYRLVLLDTASLAYPEVAPLSQSCEGTYLVVQLGRTPRRAARQAVRLIERCGGRVLGCVLTGVPVEG